MQSPDPQNLDLSDDEELANAMDYHSMIIRTHHNDDLDHIVTADEVISELEIMMEVRLPLTSCSTITHLTHKHSWTIVQEVVALNLCWPFSMWKISCLHLCFTKESCLLFEEKELVLLPIIANLKTVELITKVATCLQRNVMTAFHTSVRHLKYLSVNGGTLQLTCYPKIAGMGWVNTTSGLSVVYLSNKLSSHGLVLVGSRKQSQEWIKL